MRPHTSYAINAILSALAEEDDVPGWLASVLATVAADEGIEALTGDRPDSREAWHVRRLAALGVGVTTTPVRRDVTTP